MQIKTFRAKSIQEAFQQVRDKLGPDACVLDTREVRTGLTRRTMIEVDASAQISALNRMPPLMELNAHHIAILENSSQDELDQPSIASQLLQQELSTSPLPSFAREASVQPQASNQPNQPTESLAVLPPPRTVTPAAQQVLGELLNVGVEEQLAAELVHLALLRCEDGYRNDDWLIRGQVGQIVADRIEVTLPVDVSALEQRIIAIVGPSGVGKTTLVSKLAQRAHFDGNQQVGIIALDTWRQRAVEQLIQLADEVAAEIEVVGNIDHLARSMQRLREYDLVLIDTAGRSPQDQGQLDSLRQALEIIQPDETHLVLNVNSSQTHAANCIDRFQAVGATQICLSNLDQGNGAGQWLQPIFTAKLPIQYLSHGPQSHKDLLATNKRHLASILLGQASLPASPLSVFS